MSTVPGPETWRDAGLDQVDPGGDVEVAPDPLAEPVAGPDEYAPDPPVADPGVVVEADPADVAEQARSVPPDERDEYP